uniref:Uncharacterized protein n=1 Tax=Caenorhabditis japonica TaxID=281687 RepID=A0A8R1DSE6_CAEJA
MGDLQVDLNAALVAVKKKCVDLDETVKREDTSSLNRRGRSLTRVYVEQKFYRSKSVPTPDQVQRLEDCTQDYGPNGEERLEFTETIDAPIEELIKEDQSHHYFVTQRLPRGHAEWDHELLVTEEDGASGLLEDRTLTIRAGDHPFQMNHFTEEAGMISSRIAQFFGKKTTEEQNLIRTQELGLSVRPVYHQSNGEAYTSYGVLNRSKSVSNVSAQSSNASLSKATVIDGTTSSLSNLYCVETRHDHDSKYGHYVTGIGRYGQLPPPSNPEFLPRLPKKIEAVEHVYDEPIIHRNSTQNVSNTFNEERYSVYERKYDFKTTFPPGVPLPDGYHDYYDPSRLVSLDRQDYYSGNITRPLHYTYGRDLLEKYSDYDGSSRRPSPLPPPILEPEPVPVPEPAPVLVLEPEPVPEPEPVYLVLQKTEDLLKTDFESEKKPDYYDDAKRIRLHYTSDIDHDPIIVREFPPYRRYESQELIATFDDEEPEYEEPYEPVLHLLEYRRDVELVVFTPELPYYPPPPPPPLPAPSPVEEPVYEEVYDPVLHSLEYRRDVDHVVFTPDVIYYPPTPPTPPPEIPAPVPSERHYDEIYVGQDAIDVSLTPTFGQSTDQNNLGLEKSVVDRVREMEETMRSDETRKVKEAENRRKFEERQKEIREARWLEEQQALAEEEERYRARGSVPSSPCKIKCDKRKKPNRKDTPAPIPQPIKLPDAFVIPEKPKRTWKPVPKEEVEIEKHDDKPIGPVVFHELMYQQGILRKKYEEEHRASARPVSRPVSRANSRPSTPGPEFRSIDFPRLDEQAIGHQEASVDYVQKRIERYNAYGGECSIKKIEDVSFAFILAEAQDSVYENRAQTHSHTGEPIGPVVFHELMYQQGILRKKYEEEHRASARPVSRPVSRANSRPSTPGPEFRSIDFPRLDEQAISHQEASVDYVQKRIERYNAYGGECSVTKVEDVSFALILAEAQDSVYENRAQAHSHTGGASAHVHQHQQQQQQHGQEHHHHHHHHHESHQHQHHDQSHRSSVVYDEPSREIVYDVPHDHHDSLSEQEHLEQLKLQQQAAELAYQLAQTNSAIRQMSKSNKWAETTEHKHSKIDAHIPPNSPFVKASESHRVSTTTTTATVLHHSNSLNRQNIPPPLAIHHSHHNLAHYEHDDTENAIHTSKSTTSLDYKPVNVGHVKNLALKFNKVDEKPITTEQVIYRVRAAPPDVQPRPRSIHRIPMDEVELHEHGAMDHMTRSHHHIGAGVSVSHNSQYYIVGDEEEPTVKVRKVYKAVEDTSMLSPVSMTHENLYDVPVDAR